MRKQKRVLSDPGMSTVEYSIGLLVAAALAMLLYSVVTGGEVAAGLLGLVRRALSFEP